MALKNLGQLRAIYGDPQLLHKWSVDIPTWPTAVGNPPAGIPFMVTNVGEPSSKTILAEVKVGGFSMNYNGKVDRDGSIGWSFVENTSGDVLNYFFISYANAQQNYASVNNIDLTSAKTTDLLCNEVILSLYDTTGTVVLKTITLINVIFVAEKHGIRLGQDVETQKPEVSLHYDSYIIQNFS